MGSPIARISNVMIRIVGQLLRLDHSLDREFKTIAIAKYKGLGSIVQCTPLLQTLRHNYPKAKIIFITTGGNKILLEKLNCVDEILTINDKNLIHTLRSISLLLFKLWKRKVGVFLDLEIYSNASSLITSFSLARNRMGYYLRSSNYRLGMYTHMMYYNIQSPVSETYMQFARLLNCEKIVDSLYSLKGLGNTIDIKGKYIVINVNASDLRVERKWSSSNFTELMIQLNKTYPEHLLVLIGNKAEVAYVEEVIHPLNDHSRIINLAGKTTFDQLIGTIEQADMMITNDTGPMHLGLALEVKIVALFGPCSPQQYGGNSNATILYKNVYCSPCVHEFATPPCNGDNQCMKLIQVAEVMQAIHKSMSTTMDTMGSAKQHSTIYQTRGTSGGKNTLGIVSR